MRYNAALLIFALATFDAVLAFALTPAENPARNPARNPDDRFVQIDPSSRQFIDASGRSLLFHGSSVVYKV